MCANPQAQSVHSTGRERPTRTWTAAIAAISTIIVPR